MTPVPSRPMPPDRVDISMTARRDTVLDVIGRAERRLSLSMFRCDDDKILAGLAGARSRGVAVDVLMTPRAKGGCKPLARLRKALDQAGATVHPYADRVVKYHAKYLVADAGPALVASLNFTRKCFTRTCDALVVTYDLNVVTSLRRLMAADRAGQPLPDGLSPRLIVGPERARQRFRALIESAQSSIRLIDAKLSDPDLLALLEARRAAGIPVEILGSRWLGQVKSHGKIMLIDDRIAVVGSVALTPRSLDVRREVALIVDDAAAIAVVRRWFRMLAAPAGPGQAGARSPGWAPC